MSLVFYDTEDDMSKFWLRDSNKEAISLKYYVNMNIMLNTETSRTVY